MSIERELIKDMKILLECADMGSLQRNADVLIGRAIELLAQPEQEPVAWQLVANFITDGDILQYTYSKPRDELYEHYRVTPLYTSPQTCDVVKLQNEVYQYRHKLPENVFWSQWIECEIDYYKTYLSAPIKANIYGTLIEYQVRVLHKEPQTREGLTPREGLTEYKKGYAQAELDLKREPLSTKQAEDLWETTFKSAVTYYIFDEICVAIEQYHGIGADDE